RRPNQPPTTSGPKVFLQDPGANKAAKRHVHGIPTCLSDRRRRCGGGDGGFITAQFVMVIPLVLFAFVAAVQGGSYLHAQRIVQAAAEDGSEAARASNANAQTGRAVALDTLSQLGGSSVTGV